MAIEFREVSEVMSRVTETFLCTRLLDAESGVVEFVGGTGVASKSLCRYNRGCRSCEQKFV